MDDPLYTGPLYGRDAHRYHPRTTRCRCGHAWRPLAWQEGTRNVQCPKCRAWNQAGATHPLYRPPGTLAILAAVAQALKRAL